MKAASKNRVFLSYSSSDAVLARNFRDWMNANLPEVELIDFAHSRPDWKRRVRELIASSKATVCLVGKSTFRSSPIEWELEASVELQRPIVAVTLLDVNVPLPKALRKHRVVPMSIHHASARERLESILVP